MFVNRNTSLMIIIPFFFKSEIFSKKNNIVLDFTNLFNVWLNKRQLCSPAHFCLQSAVRSHITWLPSGQSWLTPVYTLPLSAKMAGLFPVVWKLKVLSIRALGLEELDKERQTVRTISRVKELLSTF